MPFRQTVSRQSAKVPTIVSYPGVLRRFGSQIEYVFRSATVAHITATRHRSQRIVTGKTPPISDPIPNTPGGKMPFGLNPFVQYPFGLNPFDLNPFSLNPFGIKSIWSKCHLV